jgi:hypothetical protein
MTSALNYFGLPVTDVSVVGSNYIVIPPANQLKEESAPVSFTIPANSTQCIDLSSSYLYLKVKILKADGGNLTSSDVVSPCHMYFYSIFSDCKISINGSLVSNSNYMYPYQAGLNATLAHGGGEKSSELTSILYYEDSQPDVFDPSKNDGFKARQTLSADSKVFDMVGAIPVGFCQQGKYLPTFCNVNFEFIRQNAGFCLDCADATKSYKYEVVSAELHVKMNTIFPEIVDKLNKEFEKGERAQFPFRDVKLSPSLIVPGTLNYTKEVINGKLPTTIVLGMVSDVAFRGRINRSAWNFNAFGLTSITITSDNIPWLRRRIDVDFQANNYLLGYQSLFKALPRGRRDGNQISRERYTAGNTLFVFDIQGSIGPEFHAIKSGQLKVCNSEFEGFELKFITSSNIDIVPSGVAGVRKSHRGTNNIAGIWILRKSH